MREFPQRAKFEFHVMHLQFGDNAGLAASLNEMGAEGWAIKYVEFPKMTPRFVMLIMEREVTDDEHSDEQRIKPGGRTVFVPPAHDESDPAA